MLLPYLTRSGCVILCVMRPLNPTFGAKVTQIVDEHGLSLQGTSFRTGIDRYTIGQMKKGYVPRMERVLDFARGFGLNENEWLGFAGYEPIEAPPQTMVRLLGGTEEDLRLASIYYRLGELQSQAWLLLPGDLKEPMGTSLTERPIEEVEAEIQRLEALIEERRAARIAATSADPVGYVHFVQGLYALSQQLGRPVPVALDKDAAEQMTPEKAEETLTALRIQAEEGLF